MVVAQPSRQSRNAEQLLNRRPFDSHERLHVVPVKNPEPGALANNPATRKPILAQTEFELQVLGSSVETFGPRLGYARHHLLSPEIGMACFLPVLEAQHDRFPKLRKADHVEDSL